ncbi:hypothetical protein Amir_5892 [Actinosynnema mirum DSM 43827]|uniref:Lipoprotein n=1 Tax=Actinosynnema mirum (strain ATCC 29888 / DSM 43827 / JCM 3225 / NBRC 14064 / NCIMB 13271 / NRRL B-12336 / IMRU 3971 / 101) TaxID=446462 RepID=C6WES6_ACTMD|nr:hypothetical protein Amir_5892 [Actinosynnema mirum DSM 43827]
MVTRDTWGTLLRVTRIARSTSAALALLLATACTGDTTPPGDAPGNPAPGIPDAVVGYDQLVRGSRAMPFSGDCSQLTGIVDRLGMAVAEPIGEPLSDETTGCALYASEPGDAQDPADRPESFRVEPLAPEDGQADAFTAYWGGEGGAQGYHRRFVLGGRYHAVESVGFSLAGPFCLLTVDVAAPEALQFALERPGAEAEYGRLRAKEGQEVPREAVDRFVVDTCPTAAEHAVAALAAIDPNGGSRATG